MNKIKYILSLALVSTLVLTGCSDFLEPDNKKAANQTAEELLSNDPASLRVYAYSLLKPVVSRVDVYEEGVDLYMPSNKKSGTQFDQYTITPENDDVKKFYSDLYSCINMANACIFYDKEGQFSAEMKFLRSYCYFILSQQFGSVPYITEYINNAGRSYPRTTLEDLYSQLISELEGIAGDANLAESDTKGAASKRAANALLAKVYLAAGWDLDVKQGNALEGTYTINETKYFTKALAAAKTAINNQSLVLSFEDKWSPKNEGNEEVIFAVQYERSGFPGDLKKGGHGLQNTFGSYYGDCAGTGEKYVNGMHASNPKSSYLWAAEDSRYDGTFMTTMYNSTQAGWGTEGYYAYYNVPSADQATLPVAMRVYPGTVNSAVAANYMTEHADQLTKGDCVNDPQVMVMSYPNMWVNSGSQEYMSFVNSNPGMFAAPVVKKFDDPESQNISTNMTNCYRDIVVLHLSDLYLVAAEAAMMAGQTAEAETYINSVRTRAYGAANDIHFGTYQPAYASLAPYAAFKVTDIDLLLDERARELYAEGHRWMDLRRTKQLLRYANIFNHEIAGAAASRVKWYRPIPQAEINANESITEADQNEGY